MFPVYIIHPRILLYYIAHFSPPIMWVLEIYITNVWSWSFTFRIHTYKMYIIVFRFHSAVGMIWVMDSIPWVHCASGNVYDYATLKIYAPSAGFSSSFCFSKNDSCFYLRRPSAHIPAGHYHMLARCHARQLGGLVDAFAIKRQIWMNILKGVSFLGPRGPLRTPSFVRSFVNPSVRPSAPKI